jgi:hypothetical protein
MDGDGVRIWTCFTAGNEKYTVNTIACVLPALV